jgi:hypothetical protein
MTFSARFAPSGSRVTLGVYFGQYILKCSPLDQQGYALLGSGRTEQDALDDFVRLYPSRKEHRVPFGLPGSGDTEEIAATYTGCSSLRTPVTQRPPPTQAGKKTNSPRTVYQLAWNDSGEAGYVRALNDSTALVAPIRYTTAGAKTELGVRFEQHVIHCAWKLGDPWESALVGVGDSETEALFIRGPSAGHFSKFLKRDAIVASCLAVASLKTTLRSP